MTDAVEKFKEASEAYEGLSDADKRARYDRNTATPVSMERPISSTMSKTSSRRLAICSAAACLATCSVVAAVVEVGDGHVAVPTFAATSHWTSGRGRSRSQQRHFFPTPSALRPM